MNEFKATDERIVTFAPYGQHIVLTCKNHPEKRWSTKNISHIGARTIFYLSGAPDMGPECDCPACFLKPVIPDGATEVDN